MEKYDKDRDGRISYSEFMDEILPKSPVKWEKFDSLWSKRLILILIMRIAYSLTIYSVYYINLIQSF
jgi:hypothetical protein